MGGGTLKNNISSQRDHVMALRDAQTVVWILENDGL